MKKIIFLILVCLQFNVQANSDTSVNGGSFSINRISPRVDINFMNVTGRTGFRGVGVNGTLQLDYRLGDRATLGVYGGHATDISTKERYFIIEDRVYNLTTSNMTFFGLAGGYTVWREGRFSVTPDVRAGLGYFRVNEIFNSLNQFFVLKRSLVMITPRLNFGFLIGRSVETGINFSYLIPFSVNGDISQYDLGNVSSGVFCRFLF